MNFMPGCFHSVHHHTKPLCILTSFCWDFHSFIFPLLCYFGVYISAASVLFHSRGKMLLWMSSLSHQYVCAAVQKAFKPFRAAHIWQATHLPQGWLVLRTPAYHHRGAHTEKSSLLLPSLQCLLLVFFSCLSARIFSPSLPPPLPPSVILSLSVTPRAAHL